MGALRLSVFGGVRPAVSARNSQAQQATVAHNARLRDTTLKAFQEPLAFTAHRHVGTGAPCDLHLFQDSACCIDTPTTFDSGVSVIRPPDPGSCGTFDWAVVFPCGCDCSAAFRYNPCTNQKEPLVVPGPLKAPTAALVAPGGMKDVDACCLGQSPDERSYTYTWVDRFGVESPPAPPSQSVMAWDDQSYSLSNFSAPPANAVCLRLYRATYTPVDGGRSPMDIVAPSFQLVDEYPVPLSLPIVDSRRLEDMVFGSLLTHMDCPPPCMDQVVLTESGYAVGFKGNTLYVSERHEMHNWPEKYRIELPDRIVAVAAFYDHVFLGTTGRPYKVPIQFAIEQNEASAVIDPVPFTENFPCVGRWTMTPTSFGAMYASHRGMIALAPRGEAVIVTRERIDEDDWKSWRPNVGVWHDGKYYAAHASDASRGFILDIAEEAEGALDLGDLVTADIAADKLFSGTDGRLWLLKDGALTAWAEGRDPLRYRWRSKLLDTRTLTAFTVARVRGDFGPPVTLRVMVDGRLYSEIEVCDNKPFRLCSAGRGTEWQIEVEGTTPVHEIMLATSRTELLENG